MSPPAAAIAYRRGGRHSVIGIHETSGYPHCRDDTIKAMQLALDLLQFIPAAAMSAMKTDAPPVKAKRSHQIGNLDGLRA